LEDLDEFVDGVQIKYLYFTTKGTASTYEWTQLNSTYFQLCGSVDHNYSYLCIVMDMGMCL
jgi:hypothetical protein